MSYAISIPFWSDFNFVDCDFPAALDPFQSHFGLILTSEEAFQTPWTLYFNPILVWF